MTAVLISCSSAAVYWEHDISLNSLTEILALVSLTTG